MILGLGYDFVDLAGLREQLADQASAFVESCFTEGEVRYASEAGSRDPARHLGARYAAKEATLKALDAACALAGVAPSKVPLRCIEVRRDEAGRPRLVLHGNAQDLAARVGVDRAHVSLSHDGAGAGAVVILERIL
jgi:holo-[acyl-carrier protein] synthase